MTKPLLSVVTVTKNNCDGLKKTHQSPNHIHDYEWIVIDGASTDGTLAFLETTNATYISEPDNGIYDAMNKGMALATGDYIIFMNAGDTFANSDFLTHIDSNEYDFIYGDAEEILNGKNVYKTARPHTKITHGMFTHHQSMIYNRTTLRGMTYDTTYAIASDYDFTWKTLNKSKNVLYIPKAICVFESGGISQQNVTTGRIEQFKIRRKNNVSLLKNSFIFIAQSLLYILRKISPRLYWRLKNA